MRWIIRAVLVVIAVAVIGMTALFAIPTDEITSRVTARIAETTGRTVEIRGPVRPRLFPALGIRAEDIEIGNPDWVEEGPMIVAQALDVGVSWGALLRGRVHLQSAELAGPRLILVRGSDGRVSWDMGGAAEPEPEPGASAAAPSASGSGQAASPSAAAVAFDQITISDAAVLFIDRAAGRSLQYDPVSARLSAPDPDGAAELSVTIGQPAGEIALALAVESFGPFLDGGLSELDLSVDWPGGEMSFDGRAAFEPALEGRIDLDVDSFQPLFALAGLEAPVLPEGFGRDRIRLSSQVTLADGGSLHLRDMTATLDSNQLELELDLLPGDARPLLRGNLAVGNFVFGGSDPAAPETATSGGGGAGQAAAGTGWSEAPIDASGLFALDADLAITAGRISLGDIAAETVSARIINQDGRAEVTLGYAALFQGALAGTFVANGRGTFSTRAEFEATGIALNPAVTALTGYDRLDGTGTAQVSLVAQGASVAALMRDLEGGGQINFGQGAIIGLDIGGMIRNFDAGFRGEGARTVYDEIAASFTVSDGVLSNSDLALSAPWGGVRGQGQADIGNQTLDYLVTPGLSARDDGTARVNVPVRISGPWDDLSYRPDLQALADQELSEEIDALEGAATEAARDLVREELGVVIEEGASRDEAIDQIEEAIGDRLQQELGEGLRRLLE